MKYEVIVLDLHNGETTIIQRTDEDGTVWGIPTDPANSDYQAYLAQLEEGDK
jgi:hypothetical protein